jgi:hypothetical protein
VGLPEDRNRLAEMVAPDDLARFAAGLVRVSLVPKGRDPFDG